MADMRDDAWPLAIETVYRLMRAVRSTLNDGETIGECDITYGLLHPLRHSERYYRIKRESVRLAR